MDKVYDDFKDWTSMFHINLMGDYLCVYGWNY
jgi:hypothetical protein